MIIMARVATEERFDVENKPCEFSYHIQIIEIQVCFWFVVLVKKIVIHYSAVIIPLE